MSPHLPQLSRPQVVVLSMWSLGIVLAQRCGLTQVAVFLAALLGCREQAVRARLRDGYREAAATSGAPPEPPHEWGGSGGAPLLRWVVALHPPDCRQLALAMDASTLGQRFTVLSIHVLIRGCAIPVAWHIMRATAKGAWQPQWEALFQHLHGRVPDDWTVIVAATPPAPQRGVRGGLYAKWLFQAITARGWHPFLRINRQGTYCPDGAATVRLLSQAAPAPGSRWKGTVRCLTTPKRQLACTLVARWDAGDTDPWLVLTDLPPAVADVAWYRLRAWIECSSKDLKRGGWRWEQTKMTDPRRAERLWLAMALATLWVVSVGCAAEAALPLPVLAQLPPAHPARRRTTGRRAPRSLRCFHRGRLLRVAAFIHGRALPLMQVLPEPWPKRLDTHGARPSTDQPHQKAA